MEQVQNGAGPKWSRSKINQGPLLELECTCTYVYALQLHRAYCVCVCVCFTFLLPCCWKCFFFVFFCFFFCIFCILNSQTLRRKGENSGGYKTCRTNRGLEGHRSSCADEVCIAHPTSGLGVPATHTHQ